MDFEFKILVREYIPLLSASCTFRNVVNGSTPFYHPTGGAVRAPIHSPHWVGLAARSGQQRRSARFFVGLIRRDVPTVRLKPLGFRITNERVHCKSQRCRWDSSYGNHYRTFRTYRYAISLRANDNDECARHATEGRAPSNHRRAIHLLRMILRL